MARPRGCALLALIAAGLVVLLLAASGTLLLWDGPPSNDPTRYVGTWVSGDGERYRITPDLRVTISAGESGSGPYQGVLDGGMLEVHFNDLATGWTGADIEKYLGDYAFAVDLSFTPGWTRDSLSVMTTVSTRGSPASHSARLSRAPTSTPNP